VTGQVGVLVERRVHVRRQHLAVGVNLDVGPLHLLEQMVEVEQVMAADQDPRTRPGAFGYGGRLRLTEGLDMGGVEHLHDPQVHLPAAQAELKQRFEIEVDVGHGGEQRLLHEGCHLRVVTAEPAGVVGVCGHPLEAVEQQLLRRVAVLILATDAGGDIARLLTADLLALIAEHGHHLT